MLEKASGEYIAIFDHDDVSALTRLQKEVEYLDSNKDIGVVSSYSKVLEGEAVIGERKNPIDNTAIKRKLMHECAVHHSGAMIRRSIMMDNNIRWEDAFSPCEDYMLFVRLMGITMFHNIPECLLFYRRHPNQTSALRKEKMSDVTECIRSVATTLYPFWGTPQWFYLFGIPFIKIQKRTTGSTRYLLFGWIPIARVL